MTQNPAKCKFLPPQHNHARCIVNAVERARTALKNKGLSLTPLREAIIKEIAGSHCAIGAYEVREKLRAKGRSVPPISVYRAIEFLMEAGVVRRLESGKAFYANPTNKRALPRIVFACQDCGYICDTDGKRVLSVIARTAASRAFALRSAVVEVLGTCKHCAKTGADASSRRSGVRPSPRRADR
jgi:Fur family transcriptional regulator, zinc uptake regulator